jgi:cytochrome c55X
VIGHDACLSSARRESAVAGHRTTPSPLMGKGRGGGVALVLAAAALLVSTAALAAPPPERQSELLHRLKHDCGSCHGLTLKGGLGPPLVPEVLAEREAEDLAWIIRHGLPGTPMPPWGFEIAADEALWLARLLKQGIDHGR